MTPKTALDSPDFTERITTLQKVAYPERTAVGGRPGVIDYQNMPLGPLRAEFGIRVAGAGGTSSGTEPLFHVSLDCR
jgi:hypothetical protein